MRRKIKQNALSQKLGDIFHYYIAIDLLLNNTDWFICNIEQYGDIALIDNNGNQLLNIEVKHHTGTNELKVYSEEFLKTLSNWHDIKETITDSTKLYLITSSVVSLENPLFHWNSFDKEKKYKVIIDNQKSKKENYYTNISKYFHPINKNPNILKELLEKIEIYHSQSDMDSIKKKIKENTYFSIFKTEELKNEVTSSIYGLIGNGLKDKDTWEITKEEFNQKLHELSSLAQNRIQRTDNHVPLSTIDRGLPKYQNKQFVKKLEKINFDEKVFSLAIDNYARTLTELTNRMHLSTSLEYRDRLINYESTLLHKVDEVKTEYIFKDGNDIKKSQQSYFAIMSSSKIPFMPEEFDDQTTFFQKGYFHVLADDEEKPKQLCWSVEGLS